MGQMACGQSPLRSWDTKGEGAYVFQSARVDSWNSLNFLKILDFHDFSYDLYKDFVRILLGNRDPRRSEEVLGGPMRSGEVLGSPMFLHSGFPIDLSLSTFEHFSIFSRHFQDIRGRPLSPSRETPVNYFIEDLRGRRKLRFPPVVFKGKSRNYLELLRFC